MTNMTRREWRQNQEFAADNEIAVSGTHYANALAFIVDSIGTTDEGDGSLNTSDIENLDRESRLEFAEMYNFTESALEKALQYFRSAVDKEVHNAFWDGECRNCMENPPTYN